MTADEDDSAAFGGAAGVDEAPKADAVFVLDVLPKTAKAVGALVLADDATAAGSALGVDKGAEKANDANGFELAFDASALTCSEGFPGAEDAEVEAGLTGTDAGDEVAPVLPKLNPEKAPPDVPVLAPVFAGALTPKLNVDFGAADSSDTVADGLLPNEKLDEAGAPKLIAGAADALDWPNPKVGAGGAVADDPVCQELAQLLQYQCVPAVLTAPLRFGIPRILQTLSAGGSTSTA